MNKLRVGIAGFGVVGKRRRLYIDKHPNLKTVAVCDRYFTENGVDEDGVLCFKDYRHLLEQKLDVLFVCLTNDVAAEVTVAGLERGMHVFCEKPPGRNLEDIKSVIEVEKKRPHLKLKYGFNHRYHDSVREALKLVRSGELGSVISIKGTYGKSKIISFESDWRTQRNLAGGGILLDQGIHMIDMMRLFAGEFKEIHSFVSNAYWQHDVEDNAYALMRTREGVVGFIHSSATQWRHKFNLEINLQRGAVLLNGILSGTKSYGAETITIVYSGENDGGDPKEVMVRYNADNSWKDEIWEFVDCIQHNKPVVEGCSLEAFRTMQLVYKIYGADPSWKDKWNIQDNISLD